MKVFPAHYICSFLLAKAYTKSDIKAIQDYAGKFPSHEDVDIARREMEPEISLLFDKFSLLKMLRVLILPYHPQYHRAL